MNANARYTRRVSFNERLYLAAERRSPGFCIQLVVFVDGAVDEHTLREAVATAGRANPGACLVLRGWLGFSRWESSGARPPVRIVPGWSRGARPSAEVERVLDPRSGPTCEVVFAPGGADAHLVFRCFHGVMDAAGLLHFAQDVFRAWRGEATFGAPCTLNDTEFVTELAGTRRRPMMVDAWPPLLGGATERVAAPRNVAWARARLERPVPSLVAKVATSLVRFVGSGARGLMMIPVDLRSYRKVPASTANRTCPVFLDVAASDDWRGVQGKLLKRLIAKEPLRLDVAESVAPWLPLWLLGALYRVWVEGHRRKGLFPFSALVTHVALPSLEVLSTASLSCREAYLLPPQSDFIPLCISAVTSAAATDLVVSGPADLVSSTKVDDLCEVLRREL